MITNIIVAVAIGMAVAPVIMCVALIIAAARLERQAERTNRKAAVIEAENSETRAIFRAQRILEKD